MICIEPQIKSIDLGSKKAYTDIQPCTEYINDIDISVENYSVDVFVVEDIIEDSSRLIENFLVEEYNYIYKGLSAYMMTVTMRDTTEYIWAKESIDKDLLFEGSNVRLYGYLTYEDGWLLDYKYMSCYKIEVLDGTKVVSTWEHSKYQ